MRLWTRFCEDAQLIGCFPLGLSMGLSTGRALVGNHGSDTMQRLATLGYVYTEAMRLQEAMSRRVLSKATAAAADSSDYSHPSTPLCLLKGSCLAGRCLVMGRTLQDVETALSFQVLGAVPAEHLMPAADKHKKDSVVSFAKAKNGMAFRTCITAEPLQQPVHVLPPIPSLPSAAEKGPCAVADGDGGEEERPAAFFDGTKQQPHPIAAAPPSFASPSTTTTCTILVAVLSTLKRDDSGGAAAGLQHDEWLYELYNDEKSNSPFAAVNSSICYLWKAGVCAPPTTPATTMEANKPPNGAGRTNLDSNNNNGIGKSTIPCVRMLNSASDAVDAPHGSADKQPAAHAVAERWTGLVSACLSQLSPASAQGQLMY